MDNKKLIVFCDGTWNTPNETLRDQRPPSNVLRLMRAVRPFNTALNQHQVVFYDPGIGTGNRWDRFIGGITGAGIRRNIQEAYCFLAANYRDGDEIFLFGFSRGAYTVRCLTGLIRAVGLLHKQHLELLPQAYSYYRIPPDQRPNHPDLHGIFTALPTTRKPNIKFLGVWDTVGSLGLPFHLLKRLSRRWVGFHDTNLSKDVENAYQALALDEQRGTFEPAVWTDTGHAQEVLQVWFPGVHADVGGGYVEDGLSTSALLWMVEQARKHGLDIDDFKLRANIPSAPGELHYSYTWPFWLMDLMGLFRHVRLLFRSQTDERVHHSALRRMHLDSGYSPRNLSEVIGQVRPNRIYFERSTPRYYLEQEECTLSLEQRPGQTRVCRLLDVSERAGLRVSNADGLQPEDMVRINWPGLAPDSRGRVVWVRGEQAGIRLAA